jgi:DNA helicase-2/ATP-dependent DNA helicase PcrA
LSGKYGNLLRIGDVNQAITSSFTDSDPKCFRKYFLENEQMVMKTSQRSSVQIQNLANSLLDFAQTEDYLKDTFFNSKLMPAGKNPVSDNPPSFKVFDNILEEKMNILRQIKNILKTDCQPSIAILLRNNYQVFDWTKFLADNGLSITLSSDILEQKTVYRFIMAYIEFLQTPLAKKSILNLMKAFEESRIIEFSDDDYAFIKNLQVPFISYNYEVMSESLIHLWWELQFNDELSYIPLDEAVVRIGLRYFSTQNEKSNVYLLATIIKNLSSIYSLQSTILEKMTQIAKKPIGSSFKYFDEDVENNLSVNILTMHKSKGAEFDVVFIPELSEENYSLDINKIKSKSPFSEQVKNLRNGYIVKSDFQIKKEIAEETLRLLYVGFTRAKRELYISCSKTNKYNRPQVVSSIFELGETL